MSVFPHPWKALRELDTVAVSWRDDLPPPVHAVTNGRNIIWMAKNLLQVERRCALQHELIHIEHGHTCRQNSRIEAQVRQITAERLIPARLLFRAWKAALSIEEWAESLWVTPAVLHDRLDNLSLDEQLTAEQLKASARERGAD